MQQIKLILAFKSGISKCLYSDSLISNWFHAHQLITKLLLERNYKDCLPTNENSCLAQTELKNNTI